MGARAVRGPAWRPRAAAAYARGLLHMPRPRSGDPRRCADCGRRLVPYTTKQGRPSWRHYWRDR